MNNNINSNNAIMTLDEAIFDAQELTLALQSGDKIRVECKLPTGAIADQSVKTFDALEAFLAYTSMDTKDAVDRWFSFITVDKGNSAGRGKGKVVNSAKCYMSLYTQASVHDAGLRMRDGEKLPAFRMKRGSIAQQNYERIGMRNSCRNGCVKEVVIPGCHSYDDVRQLCESLVNQSRFSDIAEDAKAARGWEFLTAMLLRREITVKGAWHVGDFTKKDGNLYQGCDVVFRVR